MTKESPSMNESNGKKVPEFVKEPEPTTKLDPQVLAAINEAVSGAVKSIVEQLKPQTPTQVAPAAKPVPQSNFGNNSTNYVTKLKGIPVEPGEDLRHVSRDIVQKWFLQVEARWKESYNSRKLDGRPVGMTLDRG